MAYNKKSLENLRQFKKGQSGNKAGRPKSLATQIEVYEILHHALALPNKKEAQKYLVSPEVEDALGEYGFLLQVALLALIGKQGWLTACDILDRLFGKPKQTTTLSGNLSLGEKPTISFGVSSDEGEEGDE